MNPGTDRRLPPAPRQDLVEVLHGLPVADPYRPLETLDARTRAWLDGQQSATDTHLAGLPARDRLRTLLADYAAGARVWPPRHAGNRTFVLTDGPGDHPLLTVRVAGGRSRVLLDPHALDPTGATSLDAFTPSPDGRLVAYQLSCGGREESVLHVVDVDRGTSVGAAVGGLRYAPVAWTGRRDFCYVRERDADPRLRWRCLDSDRDLPVAVAADPAERFGLAVWHERYLVVTLRRGAGRGNRLLLADLDRTPLPRPAFVEVTTGTGGDAVAVLAVGRDGRRYVRTTRGAPRGRLVAGPTAGVPPAGGPPAGGPGAPAEAGTDRILLAEEPAATLAGVVVLDGVEPARLVAARVRDGASELSVHCAGTGRRLARVALPGRGTVTALTTCPGAPTQCLVAYSDPVTPPRMYRLDAATGTLTPEPGPAGGTGRRPRAGTVTATCRSADGTPVPLAVVTGPGHDPAAGPRPLVLTAYGGFGHALTPRYQPEVAAWVAAGGVWATVHARGGGELGSGWHDAGRGAGKADAVADVQAAGDWLVEAGWTSRDRLALLGVSNGGLLVGAAAVRRPEAYAAVACLASLFDMVRYERSGLGRLWRAEYGSAEDPRQLADLLAYSPYHRVEPGRRYPPTLLVAPAGDTRVDPLHSRKMAAALQHADRGGGPVLLHTVAGIGHGAKPAARGLDLAADMLGFLAHHTGLDPAP